MAQSLDSKEGSPQTSRAAEPATTMGTLNSASIMSVDVSRLLGNGEDATEAQDAPHPNASGQAAPPSDRAPQTKRILGIIPNFRSVSTDQQLPPQSVKEKFVTATEDSFDYSSIVIPAALAGYSLETNATPEFGSGAAGYARYFWHAGVDQTSENYMVEFVVPALTHEDTRFYTLGRGGFLKRTVYALGRVVITRSDAGNEVFNASEVIGAGASAGISSLYYPSRERTFGNTGKEWGIDLGIDAAAFFVKEFWPDINHRFFHGDKVAVGQLNNCSGIIPRIQKTLTSYPDDGSLVCPAA